MKELSILGGATESFVMLYDKALLQVDGAGRYDVQASLDGEHWSVLTPITAKCDHHSRTIVLDLLAGAHIRVVCVTGTLESARYSFDMGETSEAERIAAEEARVEAENKRVEAENEREVAEDAREAAEAQRVAVFNSNEEQCKNGETSREAAEAARVTAENARAKAEQGRASAEAVRADAENLRKSAESSRVTAESARVSSEGVRVNAENQRKSAETSREAAEAARANAETNRVSTEAARVNAEKERATAEGVREDNEQARVLAEAERVEAEAKREERTDEAIASIANKVDRTDNAPELTSGFAGNLVGRGEATSEEIGFRPSGGLTSVNDGATRIERLKGNTLVWNQLCEGPFPRTISTENTESNNKYLYTGIRFNTRNITTHKILSEIKYKVNAGHAAHSNESFFYNFQGVNIKVGLPFLEVKELSEGTYTISEINNYTTDEYTDKSQQYWLSTAPGDKVDITFISATVYDLTQMFGAGNEPTTIEEFNERKPLGVSDAYNEGELISTTADEIKSVGFNALNMQRTVEYTNSTRPTDNASPFLNENIVIKGIAGNGYIDPMTISDYTIAGNSITVKTSDAAHSSSYGIGFPVKVFPNTRYCIRAVRGTNVGYITCSFCTDDSFISYMDAGDANTMIKGVTIDTPSNARWLIVAFKPSKQNGTGTFSDICIHLVHTGYRNGEYEPYEEFRRSLPISEIKDSEGNALFPNGLLSAGSVYDEITEKKAIKRIGVVDMGTLKWGTYSTADSSKSRMKAAINDMAVVQSSNVVGNAICSKFDTISASDTYSNVQGIAVETNQHVSVYDPSNTDSAVLFQSAMSGVMLYYELAEPIEVDLPEPLNLDYEVSDFGTEEVISDTPTTPLKADIIYQFNAVDRIRENSLSIEDLIKRVVALEAQNAALVQQLNATDNGETE